MKTSLTVLLLACCLLAAGTMLGGCRAAGRQKASASREAGAPVEGAGGTWRAQMGWRYVAYGEEGGAFYLSIEPMVGVPDIVYTPDERRWKEKAPEWARERRAEILSRLKSVAWNRELEWREGSGEGPSPVGADLNHVIPGSLESTAGGRQLEALRFFNPGSSVPFAKARERWYEASREHVKLARGRVRIFVSEVVPNSVFQVIIMPALKENPNVELDVRQVKND